MKHDYSKIKKRVTSSLERQWAAKTTFKRSITLDTSHMMSCLFQRYCFRVSLPDLIVISQEAQANTCASSIEIVVMKKQMASAYDLETASEEGALSSLIIQSDLTCTTCSIWLRVSAATVRRVLAGDKAADLAQRAWIRCWAAQVSSALVSRLYIKIWRV